MAGWKRKLRETARRNRVEIVEAGLTRRDLFKLGLLTGSGYLITKLGLSARALGADESSKSPPTTPWVEELPGPVTPSWPARRERGRTFPSRQTPTWTVASAGTACFSFARCLVDLSSTPL